MAHELVAVNLVLQPHKFSQLPPWLGRAAQAFFLDSLRRINPALSAAAHDGSTLKPFTSSTLLGGQLTADTLSLTPGQPVTLRYTTLHPHLSAVLLNGMIPAWCAEGVTLHDQPFSVSAVHMQPDEHPWGGMASFAALWQQASPRHRLIRLDFAAPTAFKATDGPFVPLPLPELVFGSLLDRWNRFASLPLPEALSSALRGQIAIQQLDIRTQEVSFGKGKWEAITGFTGSVTYRIDTGDAEVRRGLNTLAAFAVYSGVGVKLTSGMGQVRGVG